LNVPLDPARASAGELVAALAERKVGAVELLDAAIARIEAQDGPINAVVVKDYDRARAAARDADEALSRGERGPLLGLPMTVKESFDIAGLPTTWGNLATRDFVPSRDAAAVERLKAAGAVIFGKTNVPPGLADWQSTNAIYGRTSNPHDLARTPGGSSGGSSAALAAGFTALELGSDIGGSIRVPAHFCGVFGHKPSYGVVPLRGHAPPGGAPGVSPPLSVAGPLARTAQDLELALDVIAGPIDEEALGYRLELPAPRHETPSGFRLLVLDSHPRAKLDPAIRQAIQDLASRWATAGASLSYQPPFDLELEATHRTYVTLLNAVTARRQGKESIPANAWLEALDQQLAIRRRWAALFEQFDAVLAPVFGATAFAHIDETDWRQRHLEIDGETTPYGAQLVWSGLASLANLPATAAPLGVDAGGLPFGVQIIGPYLEDRTPLRLARYVSA